MIPTDFRLKMQRRHGDSGVAWTAKAEKLMHTLKHRLNLSYGEPFSLSYNFVVPVLLNNHKSGVLKIGYPNQDFNNEFHALCDFQGRGMVGVMDCNQEEGWILLEHLKPGTPLHALESEEEVVKVFASVAKRLWHMSKDPAPYPTVQILVKRIKPPSTSVSWRNGSPS